MTTRCHVTIAAAAALLLAAPAALGQEITLRIKAVPGQRWVYERTLRTDTTIRSDQATRRTVTEVPVRREELVIESKDNPPSVRVVILEVPVGERLVTLEENGQNRLDMVPEANRLRPMPPLLSSYWRSLSGRPTDELEAPKTAAQALDRLQSEMRFLPEKPVRPGQTWSREVDLGVAKAVITTKFVKQQVVQDTPSAILESSATVTFGGESADRIKVEKITSRLVWATDGSGKESHSGSMVLGEKVEKAEQHIVRSWQDAFAEMGSLSPDTLEKAKGNLEELEKATDQLRAGDLEAALRTLSAYLKANPSGAWTAAVQNMHAGLARQRLLTQALPAPRLRLVLRDLQVARDQAGTQTENPDQLAQVDQTLSRIADVNAKTLLMDAANPDPIVRDLAAFGLAFAKSPEAADRLKTMVRDASSQVRGTALIGMTIQNRPIEQDALVDLLKDTDPRTRGAAALLASRTIKKDDPKAAQLLPLLLGNLTADHPWARVNTASSIAALAPAGSVPAVRALIDAYKAEQEERVKPVYLDAMKQITGVDGKDLAEFEAWLKKQPAPKEPAAKPKG